MTALTDDPAAAFEAALAKDAGIDPDPVQVPPPPRKPERDPDAPHGRDSDGNPLTPYGVKRDGTPRIKPAGPGRPKGDEAPRVTAAPATDMSEGAEGTDYAPGLIDAGQSVWLLLSVNHGIGFGKRRSRDGSVKPLVSLPDTRPYAAVFRQQLPMLAGAWSEAANQNATVRHYVSKIAGGEGEGVSWVLGVTVSSAVFALGCAQLAKKENAALRAELAEKNDGDLGQFFQSVLEKIGMAEAA